ncbi:hypothetical protein SAMN05421736_10223 [Evansella caseinilytica]|uniref:Uncharacterized protein n=1 Tax=Evansella caseinilytica TaxID=1503961 RepID=A0A1H3K1F2_9BACI|nr:hypothetical protein [Evansella caseinilytica]SDY46013.1 hypothetical protein SAMN05421736_10223 [Evansella caseinilytica]
MSKVAITLGVLAASGAAALLMNPACREKVKAELAHSKEILLESCRRLKDELRELIDVGIEMKETAVSYIKEAFPAVLQRYEKLTEDVKPYLEEFKDTLLQVEELINTIINKFRHAIE